MLDKLFHYHRLVVGEVPSEFRRYLYADIEWESPCICISGARGTGKTTLLLQHFHERYGDVGRCLYLSADNIDVMAMGLLNIANEYFKYGGEALLIDEVHKYPSWQAELKNIADLYKKKRIVFSGSSAAHLQKGKADLSRRVVYYTLRGLSFREFLQLKTRRSFPVVSLEGLIKNHLQLEQGISAGIPVLKHFSEYLKIGYYPFFLEGASTYTAKVLNVIEKVLYEDVAVSAGIRVSYIPVLKRLLWIIATSVPFTVNIEKLSRDLGVAKTVVYAYLEYLTSAGLVQLLREEARGLKIARKPEKVLMDNVTLLEAVGSELKTRQVVGTARETFFVNQCSCRYPVALSKQGDFIVGGKYDIEVGGENKGAAQLKKSPAGYIAADGIEVGAGRKIPLYLFGFLY
jgi:predicted AAA+ superfamily ATPase